MSKVIFKQFKERGELCEFCGEPTSIASRDKHKRGVICTCDWQDRKAEQYAQAKVLEALERLKVFISDKKPTLVNHGDKITIHELENLFLEYIETEVKPKYE